MKKALLFTISLLSAVLMYGQTTYYWVGGANPTTITTASNWNTALDGSGSTRPSSTGGTDILVFNGANIGGATPATGVITVPINGGVTCAQLKFINNANVNFLRTTTGTGTITLNGGTGDDFFIEAGSTLNFNSTVGSVVIAMSTGTTGRVSGNFYMITTLQARIANLTGTPGSLVFTNGSLFRTNITSSSSAYAFGSNAQSTEKWVVFESGSHIYYEGGFSPMGNNSAFSAIDFKPGSYWHQKATNPATGFGSFFNRKSFANIVVENGASLVADGPIQRIDTLTVQAGCIFTTHTSGQTVILGDLTVNGTLNTDPTSTNELVFGGATAQGISGVGSITAGSLVIADDANVTLNKAVTINKNVVVYGKLNLGTNQINGAANFTAIGKTVATAATGNPVAGNYMVTGNTTLNTANRGSFIAGSGLAPNTSIVSFSSTGDTVFLSKPVVSSGTGVSLTVGNRGATLQTANPNGFDPVTGSIVTTGSFSFQPEISYVIDGATTTPFGISTVPGPFTSILSLTSNAAITTNSPVHVKDLLQVNSGKISVRAGDTLHLLSGAALNGVFGPTTYIITLSSASSGLQGFLRRDGLTSAITFPVGTVGNYLPVLVTPASTSDFAVSVFEGITEDGLPNGVALTAAQKQTKVNAVWNVNRINGTGNGAIELHWTNTLEGSTFTTWPDSDIGVIENTHPGWALPVGPGDNTTNTASLTVTNFGPFSVGAKPPSQPFVFNPIPNKTYGAPDFTAGVVSLNTSQPITYTSSNTAVATIVGSNIHIVGIGNTTITAQQASDGFYPAASVSQPLTVVKAPLTIQADNKTKPQGDPNPVLTATYTGFVNGETLAVLTTPVTLSTTATTSSAPGSYPITVSGATAANYNITFVNGTMTVTARQNQTITMNAFPVKTYGNADFAIGASSTNGTIPITYTSSNPAVATIVGNNIHIVGAGTTDITASQAGNGLYFPAPDVVRTLTVNKANLTVRALDTSRLVGTANPPFNLTYTGFVLGQNVASLTTAPSASTVATPASTPGYYAIDVSGGVSSNYNFIYVAGKLTVLPSSGTTANYLQVFQSGSNDITVRVYSPIPDLGDIYIYDLGGHLLQKKNVFLAQGFMSFSIRQMLPASGLYLVRVKGKSTELKTIVPLIR